MIIDQLREFLFLKILNTKINSSWSLRKNWRLHNKEHLYDYLIEIDGFTISHKIYNFMTGSGICSICCKPTKFDTFKKGYRKTCSYKCSGKFSRSKTEETNLKKYGVKCVLSDKRLMKKSLFDKYGVSNIQRLESTKTKTKNTKLKKYGDMNYNNSDKNKATRIKNNTTHDIISINRSLEYSKNNTKDIMFNARQAFLLKYKVENPSLVPYIIEKKQKDYFNKYKQTYQSKFHTVEQYKLYTSKEYLSNISIYDASKETGFSQSNISKQMIKFGIRDHFRSSLERKVVEFIKSFYQGEVIINSRKIIDKELDIYIPEYKFAIEINGDYWHSSKFIKSHFYKFNKCKEKNIYLLQIFEHQLNTDFDKFKSKIKLKLNIYKQKIYVNDCIIKEISSKLTLEYLNLSHIDNYKYSSIQYGLYHNSKLVSIMTFKRINLENYELVSFCDALNIVVIESTTKLLSYFDKNINSNLISFSDNLYSNGSILCKLGFVYVENTQTYFYVKNNIRTTFQKQDCNLHKIYDAKISKFFRSKQI